jgi:arsenate reductase
MRKEGWLRVLALGFALAVRLSESHSAEGATAKVQVLMVCEHGNVKSLMAASYFNELALARHLPFVAVARGSAPDSTTVPPAIVAGLRVDGFEMSQFHPTKVAASDVAAADRVILISTDLPADISVDSRQLEQWSDVPPASVNYGAARDALQMHVRALIGQLVAIQKPK